jgi:predicted transposase YbfD/YdcC
MSEADYSGWSGLAKELAQVIDARSLRGRRYEWAYLLVLLAAALLAGRKTLVGMHDWLSSNKDELVQQLQPRRKCIPSLSTLGRVLQRVNVTALEQACSRFQRELAAECGEAGTIRTRQDKLLVGQALDGKTVCGASAHGELVHLVSLVRHEIGLVYDQDKAGIKKHERRVAETIFARNDLQDIVVTTDAMHTCQKQARQICQAGGDYLFVVKGNQRALAEAIRDAYTVLPPVGTCEEQFWQYETATVRYRGHGRTEYTTLESTTALNLYLAFPDVAQVVRRTRQVTKHSTRKTTVSTEYLITSLDRDRVSLTQIEACRRRHWTIENVVHYPRDESFGEDRSQVHAGNAPQALAALRNAVAALLRIEGWTSLPGGFRYYSNSPQRSLQLLGVPAT